jgi:hypothetical protein
MDTTEIQRATIAALNDRLRKTFTGGTVMITHGIRSLDPQEQSRIIAAVRAFDAFTGNNDPYGEHDCATLTVGGMPAMFKIDYYDTAMEYASPAPWDAAQTRRVLTVMLADEN